MGNGYLGIAGSLGALHDDDENLVGEPLAEAQVQKAHEPLALGALVVREAAGRADFLQVGPAAARFMLLATKAFPPILTVRSFDLLLVPPEGFDRTSPLPLTLASFASMSLVIIPLVMIPLRLSIQVETCPSVCTATKEQGNTRKMTVKCCGEQRRCTVSPMNVHPCARVEEDVDNVYVTILRGCNQRNDVMSDTSSDECGYDTRIS